MQYEPIYLWFFIIITIYLGIAAIHLIIKAIKSKESGRNYYLSMAFFAGFYCIARILLDIELAYYAGDYYPLYQWGSFFAVFGLFGFMFAVERYVYPKLKYIPSILILLAAALILIFPTYDETNLITYWALLSSICGILIPFLYLNVGLRSTGEVRNKSLFLAFAIIIFFVGKGLNFYFLLDMFAILRIIVPIMMLCGLILFHIGLIR